MLGYKVSGDNDKNSEEDEPGDHQLLDSRYLGR